MACCTLSLYKRKSRISLCGWHRAKLLPHHKIIGFDYIYWIDWLCVSLKDHHTIFFEFIQNIRVDMLRTIILRFNPQILRPRSLVLWDRIKLSGKLDYTNNISKKFSPYETNLRIHGQTLCVARLSKFLIKLPNKLDFKWANAYLSLLTLFALPSHRRYKFEFYRRSDDIARNIFLNSISTRFHLFNIT